MGQAVAWLSRFAPVSQTAAIRPNISIHIAHVLTLIVCAGLWVPGALSTLHVVLHVAGRFIVGRFVSQRHCGRVCMSQVHACRFVVYDAWGLCIGFCDAGSWELLR